jgi:non-specific serine/threonine protein kinase
LRGAGQVAWIARLETELPNLRAVLDWSLSGGDGETGLRLVGALYWFWFLRNHVGEGRAWFERARAAGTKPAAAAGKAALGAALLAWRAAEYATSKAFGREALERFQECGDRWGTAMVVHHLGHLAEDLERDMERSTALLADSMAQFAAIDDPWGVAFSQRCLGRAWMDMARDYDRAVVLLQPALATFRQVGDPWNVGVTLHMLGDAARETARWPEAIASYQESLTHHWTQRDALGVADALLRLAQILVALGDVELAVRFFGCAEAQREQAGVMVYEPVRIGYEQAVATAFAKLGAEWSRAGWDAGRSLPLSEAVAEALAIVPDTSRAGTASSAAERGPRLTRREREVLCLVAAGLTNRQIAERIFTESSTVRRHLANLYEKLGLHNRVEATRYALEHELCDGDARPASPA